MASFDLKKIKLGVSPITGGMKLYREGKEKGLALDSRPIEAEFFSTLVLYMTHGSPEGSTKLVSWGKGNCYRVTVLKVSDEDYAEEKDQRASHATATDPPSIGEKPEGVG